MAKLVDAYGLGPYGETLGGSTPSRGTIWEMAKSLGAAIDIPLQEFALHATFKIMSKAKLFVQVIVSCTFLITGLILTANTIRADSTADYQKYLQIYNTYREKHALYLTTRGEYLTYGTLTAKNNAIIAVKEMMLARDDVLLQHYRLLRNKYTSYTIYQPLLDVDEKFVTDHKLTISPVADLEDAVQVSKRLESQHISLQVNSRKIVGAILYAKLENLKNKVIQTESSAQNIINQLKSQNKDVTNLERWLLDAQNKRIQAEIKQQEMSNMISAFKPTNLDNISRDFSIITSSAAEANQYLKETLNYLNELKESIKYGNY